MFNTRKDIPMEELVGPDGFDETEWEDVEDGKGILSVEERAEETDEANRRS